MLALLAGTLAMAAIAVPRWGVVDGWVLTAVTLALAVSVAGWLATMSLFGLLRQMVDLQAKHVETFARFVGARGDRDPKGWARDKRLR
jgi:hypothetical protein